MLLDLDLGPHRFVDERVRRNSNIDFRNIGYAQLSVITKQYLDVAFCLAVLLSRSYVLVMSQNNSIPF